MATTANNISSDISIAEMYWQSLNSLSDNVKLRLATMLTSSVVDKADRKESSAELTQSMLQKYSGAWVEDFAGRWQDDRTTEQMISDIHEARTTNREIEL